MEIECDKCGKANPPGSKFCNQCGNPFSNPFAAREMKGAFRPSQQLQTTPEPESLGNACQKTLDMATGSGVDNNTARFSKKGFRKVLGKVPLKPI